MMTRYLSNIYHVSRISNSLIGKYEVKKQKKVNRNHIPSALIYWVIHRIQFTT